MNKEIFERLTSLKQRKIIGISLASKEAKYYSKPCSSIITSNTVNLNKYHKPQSKVSNSSLLDNANPNKWVINAHIGFEIKTEISNKVDLSQYETAALRGLINKYHLIMTITNASLKQITHKDHIGWFYSHELENSMKISKGFDEFSEAAAYLEINESSTHYTYKKPLSEDIQNPSYLKKFNYLKNYIALYPGDILLSEDLIPDKVIDEKNSQYRISLMSKGRIIDNDELNILLL